MIRTERNKEGGPDKRFAFYGDIAARFYNELLYDIQSNPAASVSSAFVTFIKPFKDMFYIRRGNADTIITYGNLRHILSFFNEIPIFDA